MSVTIFKRKVNKRMPSTRAIKEFVAVILSKEGVKGSVSVIFVDDLYIRELNKRYRKVDRETDVLSFPLQDEFQKDFLGEIYISVERAAQQAEEYGEEFHKEIFRLITHGLLHLIGYDDRDKKGEREMREKEEEYLKTPPQP